MKSNLTVHRQKFRDLFESKQEKFLPKYKEDYLSATLSEIKHYQKHLRCLTNDLMSKRREDIIPLHHDDKVLADKICNFFDKKHKSLDKITAEDNSSYNMS